MLYLGDNLEVLKTLEANSIDAVVTDPPYGWRFMGKAWDGADIEKTFIRDKTIGTDNKTTIGMAAGKYEQSCSANQSFQLFSETWAREVFRVLKPGGHMLVFCGPRTYHRMASGVEDAGFEIRDQLQWIFGSGFPKSHDVSKGIDKSAGAERKEFVVDRDFLRRNPGYKLDGIDRKKEYSGTEFKEGLDAAKRFAPMTDAAKQWQGWGTALKPANEPIVLARKPLSESTVAKNVERWGVGALNIEASRIGFANEADAKAGRSERASASKGFQAYAETEHNALVRSDRSHIQGRWPANVLFDEEVIAGQEWSKFFYVAKTSKRERNAGLEGMPAKLNDFQRETSGLASTLIDGVRQKGNCGQPNQNHHPTVKPIKLMEYLCRLIAPPNGIVLDPFMGSGSTGCAAVQNGYEFIGIELDKDYFAIAEKRIEHFSKPESA